MKGTLRNTKAGWFVLYQVIRDEIISGYDSIPLHPDDIKQIEQDSQVFDNIESRIAAYPDVEFEIVQEWNNEIFESSAFSFPIQYAKLINHVPDVGKMVEDDIDKVKEGDKVDFELILHKKMV